MLWVKIIEKKAIEKLEAEVNQFLRDNYQTVEYAAVKKDVNVYYSAMIVYKSQIFLNTFKDKFLKSIKLNKKRLAHLKQLGDTMIQMWSVIYQRVWYTLEYSFFKVKVKNRRGINN